jgi:hypothetical protein
MNDQYTYQQIAENFSLWSEYVDPSGLHSQEDFDAMTLEEKIDFQVKCFGAQEAK